jgi:ketosteroid isomerase-like protein
MSTTDVAALPIDQYHLALAALIRGDPDPYKALFSHEEDVTLGYPFGPVACGWAEVVEVLDMAATVYRDGETLGFENLATCVTGELAYIVEIERFQAKVAGAEQISPVSLRVTSVFRPEAGAWRVVHRHADPITTARPPESVIER